MSRLLTLEIIMKKPTTFPALYLPLLITLSVSVIAQDPAPSPNPTPPPPPTENAQVDDTVSVTLCPKITLKAPTQTVREGTPVRLTASLAGGDKKVEPMFDWSVSTG